VVYRCSFSRLWFAVAFRCFANVVVKRLDVDKWHVCSVLDFRL